MYLSNEAYAALLQPLMEGGKGVTKIAVNINMAREIMRKFPQDRTTEEIDVLFDLLSTMPFFKQLPKLYIKRLASCIVSKYFRKNEPIMLQSDAGE